MSLLIDGIPTFRIARSQGSRTLLSSAFVAAHFPGRRLGSPFALTLKTAEHTSLTVMLACVMSPGLDHDVVLALDWKAHLRDLLLSLGERVPAAFDPWSMVLGPGKLSLGSIDLRLNLS
ncbi:hypothetical protein R3P38DRAFT_1891555 [Favolaschia claudopus]|uniref:Uncharacterized protein n=1 Tax=Favolaschia claudopus TaxID=2862362 RepID=A0AAW0A1U0_9AGAR